MYGRPWTDDEVSLLVEMYSRTDIFVSDMAARLGRTLPQVYNKARLIGLRRPLGASARAGRIGSQTDKAKAHRFTAGHVPSNKGKKMSPELYAKCAPTMFRKGNKPLNHRPVGSERVNVNGYVEIKVEEPNRWRLKHRVVWEEANGPIPEGYNVQFRDGNGQNCELGTLYLTSRSDQLRNENGMMVRYPEDLRKVIRLKGTLKRQITMYNKKNNHE